MLEPVKLDFLLTDGDPPRPPLLDAGDEPVVDSVALAFRGEILIAGDVGANNDCNQPQFRS